MSGGNPDSLLQKLKSWFLELSFGKKIMTMLLALLTGSVIPYFVGKWLENEKVYEKIENLFDPLHLEVSLTSDSNEIINRAFSVSILYRDDCNVEIKKNSTNDFLLSCSKATAGEPIHFEVLSGDMFCGKFDRQIGGSPEDIAISQCSPRF